MIDGLVLQRAHGNQSNNTYIRAFLMIKYTLVPIGGTHQTNSQTVLFRWKQSDYRDYNKFVSLQYFILLKAGILIDPYFAEIA